MRLKFIQPWGPYQVGDIKVTESPTTRHYLIDVHRVAIEVGEERIPEPPIDVAQSITQVIPEAMFFRAPVRDKMLRGPRKAKAETPDQEPVDNE